MSRELRNGSPEWQRHFREASTTRLVLLLSDQKTHSWACSALWLRDPSEVLDETIRVMQSRQRFFSGCAEFLRYMTLAEVQQGIERFVVTHPDKRAWVTTTLLPAVGGSLTSLKDGHAVTWPFYARQRPEAWVELLR